MSSDLVNAKIRQKPNIIVRKEENCYLFVDRQSGKLLVMNDVGFKTWVLLKEAPLSEVLEEIASEYSIDKSVCEKEVMKLVRRLLSYGFIELV